MVFSVSNKLFEGLEYIKDSNHYKSIQRYNPEQGTFYIKWKIIYLFDKDHDKSKYNELVKQCLKENNKESYFKFIFPLEKQYIVIELFYIPDEINDYMGNNMYQYILSMIPFIFNNHTINELIADNTLSTNSLLVSLRVIKDKVYIPALNLNKDIFHILPVDNTNNIFNKILINNCITKYECNSNVDNISPIYFIGHSKRTKKINTFYKSLPLYLSGFGILNRYSKNYDVEEKSIILTNKSIVNKLKQNILPFNNTITVWN